MIRVNEPTLASDNVHFSVNFASMEMIDISSIHCQLLVFFELWLLKHVELLAGWTLHDMIVIAQKCPQSKVNLIK